MIGIVDDVNDVNEDVDDEDVGDDDDDVDEDVDDEDEEGDDNDDGDLDRCQQSPAMNCKEPLGAPCTLIQFRPR